MDPILELFHENRYYHFARKESFELEDRSISTAMIGKPNGFWYSLGSSWYEWCMSGDSACLLGGYLFEVEIDRSKIAKIDGSDREVKQLEKKYPQKNKPLIEKMSHPDWKSMSKDFKGFEVSRFGRDRLKSSMWYYGWDCSSGCIWDTSAIKSMKLLASRNRRKEFEINLNLRLAF